MRNTIAALASLALAILPLSSCSGPETSGSNRFVSTFTAGTISRFDKVYLVLSDTVPQSVAQDVDIEDVMSISPSVDGKFTLANGSTIVFTPSDCFDRDETYTVSAKVGKLFSQAEGGEKKFNFRFHTMPMAFSASFSGLEPEADGDAYAMEFHVRSQDREDSTTVRAYVKPSEGETRWLEDGDGYGRTLRVVAKAQESGSRELNIYSVANDSLIASALIPGANEPQLYDVVFRKVDGQGYVEVSFTQRLDPGQQMSGLALIEGCRNTQVVVDANKLRLFPDGGSRTVTVFISGALRFAKGMTLGQDVRRTVALQSDLPDARFTSEGVIVPQSDKVTIPFQSIGMRGVRVRVFRIFKDNIGNMLQERDIDSYGSLARYGRPVAVKTVMLDKGGVDLLAWHTFGIDLSQIMKTEPGAVYRVELEMDKALSAWEGANDAAPDDDAIARKDALTFNQLCDRFNSGETWYYLDYYWDWKSLDDPTKDEYYTARPIIGRNILATNIGLTALSNGDGKMRVVALNLQDAKPLSGVNVSAFSQQKQLLNSVTTDADGIADIAYDSRQGVPLFIVGTQGDDVSYLRVARGEELSTSTFDVSGEVVQSGIKCFLYGDRGVWRPGDTVHLTAMIQSQAADIPADHPVELELRTPVGTLCASLVSSKGQNGVHTFDIPIEASAPTGVYTAKVTIGAASFSKSVRIETIKPNRLKIDLSLPRTVSSRGGAKASLHTEWLTGATAHDMKYTMTATMVPTRTSFDKFPHFVFDSPERKTFSTRDETIAYGTTDGQGDATANFNPQVGRNAPGMMQASVTTKVFEPSGEFSIDVSRCLLSPFTRYAGISTPQTSDHQLDCGVNHKFTVASVDENGRPQAGVRLDVQIYKVEYWWWWSSSDGDLANYSANEWNRPVKTGSFKTDASGKATFDCNIGRSDWGTYLIKVSDNESGHSSGTLAYFDWPEMVNRGLDGKANAMTLNVMTDKEEYTAGESMRLTFPSAAGANAIVNICRGSRILSSQIVGCAAGKTSVDISVTDEMTPNVYAIVSLVQPYANTKNDNPIRLYGVAQASVTSPASHLNPVVSAEAEARPMQPMTVRVSEENGKPMSYTLAVVDEGLLDLTRFKTPDPWAAFNAREALGLRMWDLYNMVAGAYGGRIEGLFSIGGDDALNSGPKAVVNRFTPMAYSAGPFTIGKGESRSHKIDVPNYMGRVRVMVVASDGKAAGHAEKSVKVTKPLMILGTMPRQIGVGDKARVSATVFTNKAMGNVSVSLEAKNGVRVSGSGQKTANFSSATDKTIPFDIEAGPDEGEATIKLTCSANGETAVYEAKLKIRKETSVIPHTERVTVKPGQSWTGKSHPMPAGSTTERTIVELTTIKPLNLASRVDELIAYPHGCAEQTTSKAFAQLYLGQFCDLTADEASRVDQNVNACITRLTSYATADGGVAYWPGQSYADMWCSAYVYLFYTEAEARGFYVQPAVKKSLRNFLRSRVSQWRNTDKGQAPNVALALFALANDVKAQQGAMNRLKEELTKSAGWPDYAASDSRNWLAAAYAKSGNKQAAKSLLSERATGSCNALRLIALTLSDSQEASEMAASVSKEMADDGNWMSTYSTSLAIMGWHAFAQAHKQGKSLKANVAADGKSAQKIDSDKCAWVKTMADSKSHTLKVDNKGDGDLTVILTTYEKAQQADAVPQDNGLSVSVEGMPRETVKAGAVFDVTVSVVNTSQKERENVAIQFVLPAGFEAQSVKADGLSHTDIRDDRVLAYVDLLKPGASGRASFVAKLTATYAGDYYAPAADARMMYDDKVQGNSASGRISVED